MRHRRLLSVLAACALGVSLCGCMAAAVGGAVAGTAVGVAGAAAGVTAKGVGMAAGAVIPDREDREDKGGKRR